MSIVRYGYEFPDGTTDASIELWTYRNDPEGSLGKAEHMLRAIAALFPEYSASGSPCFVMSDWTLRRIRAWCEPTFVPGDENFMTWWGPSSAGKTADAAMIALIHWLSAPMLTTVTIASTTKDTLQDRIWGEVIKYYMMYEGQLPGTYHKSKMKITMGDEKSKACIRGVAVQQGTVAEAKGNLIGVHNEYNVLIIDEMQATRRAAIEAFDNLSTGREAKFLGMGNPESRLDPLGEHSEPVAGWDSISPENESWRTRFGKTLYFDGMKSPAIGNPKKYYFLLNQKQIDDLAKKKGENSPSFWSMRRGFIPPEGLTQTVLTESLVVKHGMNKPAEWKEEPMMVASVDPAYATRGDQCLFRPAKIGTFSNGLTGIEILPIIRINLELKKDKPMLYYISDRIIAECKRLGIRAENLAVDCTSVQGMLVDAIEKDWQRGVMRIDTAGKPSELPVSQEDHRPAKEVYGDRITELWFNVVQYGIGGQIRGLNEIETLKQFCSRELNKEGFRFISIESKDDMRSRTGGRSPDDADTVSFITALARERLRIVPTGVPMDAEVAKSVDLAREYDFDSSEESYLTSEV